MNDADADRRRAYLRSCARHLAGDGQLLLERFEPGWEARTEWPELGDVRAWLALRRVLDERGRWVEAATREA